MDTRTAPWQSSDLPADGRAEAARQELRIGVVLTGGVSLAVWMGGVVAELHRLASRSGAYRTLTALIHTDVSIDVIGGSSAGGINGAVLAMALTHNTDASSVRDIWVERASLRDLLRDATDGSRNSLLRGDSYFLPQLRAVFSQLHGPLVHPSRQPMDLLLTGTLLDGVATPQQDDFGSTFTDTIHRAEFRFRRGGARGNDDFGDPNVGEKLALAARATSSFPGAFEPAFCPVRTGATGDLAGHVNFAESAFVIDGGVIVNKPLRPVLDAVISRRDEPGVRRVVAYIQPAPDQEEARGEDLPALGRVLQAGLLTLPHAESLARELRELHDYNARVVRRRGALAALIDAPTREVMLAAEHLVGEYVSLARAPAEPQRLPADEDDLAAWPWSVDEVRHALEVLEALAATASVAEAALRGEIDRLRYEVGRAPADEARRLGQWCDALHAEIADVVTQLVPGRFGASAAAHVACRRWLLAGAVVIGIAASGRQTGAVPIDLLHISAEAPNAYDGRRRPSQKLAGLQLQHFGAFYRSAWRANDWMWGRLDGISRLVQMLLAPGRLHDLATADRSFAQRFAEAVDALAKDTPGLPDTWRHDVRVELAALAADPAARLPRCVQVVTATMQLAALAEELPRVADQIAADERAGHRPLDASRALRDALPEQPTPDDLVSAFVACRIGEERLGDDVGSTAYEDLMDRLTRLCLGTGRTSRAPNLLQRGRGKSPLWRAVQHAAILSRWPLLVVSAALAAGTGLVMSAASLPATTVCAVLIGSALLLTGAAAASVLTRRTAATLIAAAVALLGCVALVLVGPWAWRTWLLAAVGLDVLVSFRRARRLRRAIQPYVAAGPARPEV